jgi:hypothetical protein
MVNELAVLSEAVLIVCEVGYSKLFSKLILNR